MALSRFCNQCLCIQLQVGLFTRHSRLWRQLDVSLRYLPQLQLQPGRFYAKKSKGGKKQKAKFGQFDFDDEIVSFTRMKDRLQSVITELRTEYNNSIVSRITPAILDSISVSTKDGKIPLTQMALVTAPSPQYLQVSLAAFPEVTDAAAVAIRNSGLNLNPIVDGFVLKVPIPKMTKEQRERLVKIAKTKCDKAKVDLRRIRQDYINDLKKVKGISEDDVYITKDKIQAMLEDYSGQLDVLLEVKSKDLIGK